MVKLMQHPAPDRLAAFGLGRLNETEMLQISEHLAGCPVCCRAIDAAPVDRLVRLLRHACGSHATAVDGPWRAQTEPTDDHPRAADGLGL